MRNPALWRRILLDMEWLPPLLAGCALGAVAGLLVGRALAGSRAGVAAADARAAAEREHNEALQALEREKSAEISQLQSDLRGAETELKTWREAEEERRVQQEAMEKQLKDAFSRLASDALDANSTRLLEKTDLRLKPFEERLKELQSATSELEKTRVRAYSALDQQLRQLHESTSNLHSQSEKLATALRGSSQARGNWGESTLRRLVEMAQMSEHCDFDEQVTTSDGSRPDLVVRLPGKGAIPIDAKAPLAAYLDAMEAPDPASRAAKMRQHSADVRKHIRDLQKRDYGSTLGQSVDFTVLFLPGESFLAAALEADKDIFESALANRVLLATPVTLLALLRTVRMNWDHVQVEKNAREIQAVALELFERFVVFGEHFARSGKALGSAVDAYNKAVGSYERRVVPSGRRLAELRVGDADKLPEPPAVDRDVRELQAPE